MGQRNHATSQDHKIMQPLKTKKIKQRNETKKKHITFWDKKIMQPLGTKKSRNFLGQKNQTTS